MKVINNILFKDYFNELKEIVYSSNFAWFYQKKTTHYEDDNNFYKLRKRNKYNIFGKTRCTSNPPSGSLRKRCKNN